jgi:hypothetical protein
MMKKKLLKQVLLLLLAWLVMTPTIYAQRHSAFISSAEKIVRRDDVQPRRAAALAFVRTELFFGRNRPNGAEISLEEFNDFLNVTIMPEFPDGLTVLDGIGQFRDSNGDTIREKAKVLILLYLSNARKRSSRKIERIRTAYKNRFEQQSVLRVDHVLPARVSF